MRRSSRSVPQWQWICATGWASCVKQHLRAGVTLSYGMASWTLHYIRARSCLHCLQHLLDSLQMGAVDSDCFQG